MLPAPTVLLEDSAILCRDLVDWNGSRLCRFAECKTWGADPRVFFWFSFHEKRKVTRSSAGGVEALAQKFTRSSQEEWKLWLRNSPAPPQEEWKLRLKEVARSRE
jgi:hypothetical protein